MNILKSGTSSGTPSADELARLIRQAGERPAPSASLEQSVFVAVEREWRAAAIRRKHARAWRFGLEIGRAHV